MEQEGIGSVQLVAADDRFVAFTAQSITGRVAMLLDRAETRQLLAETEAAAARAFGPDWKTG
jgi:hypothetical protein